MRQVETHGVKSFVGHVDLQLANDLRPALRNGPAIIGRHDGGAALRGILLIGGGLSAQFFVFLSRKQHTPRLPFEK
jgi:hypothetical protein